MYLNISTIVDQLSFEDFLLSCIAFKYEQWKIQSLLKYISTPSPFFRIVSWRHNSHFLKIKKENFIYIKFSTAHLSKTFWVAIESEREKSQISALSFHQIQTREHNFSYFKLWKITEHYPLKMKLASKNYSLYWIRQTKPIRNACTWKLQKDIHLIWPFILFKWESVTKYETCSIHRKCNQELNKN